MVLSTQALTGFGSHARDTSTTHNKFGQYLENKVYSLGFLLLRGHSRIDPSDCLCGTRMASQFCFDSSHERAQYQSLVQHLSLSLSVNAVNMLPKAELPTQGPNL